MLEKIKSLGLRWKFGFIIFFVLLVVVGILLITLRGYLNREFELLYGAASTKGEFIAELLADELKPIVQENIDSMEVEQITNRYKAAYSPYGLSYILVHRDSGELVFDTIKDVNTAQQLLAINPLSQESPCASFSAAGGKKYYDCAAFVSLAEESRAVVRVGVIDHNPESTAWEKLKASHVKGVFTPLLIISALLVVLVTVLLTLAFWFFVVRRIVSISQATERMSFGDLETIVDVRTQDEMGVLEDTLERMRANLKDAIERLKRRK
ncbi:MAG: HAMP domain-containing protein [Candidatus Vecturithrix sp.]|jgi:HAMP domain-containing protein|nr:HAMP domain-containing protein [Candidatus Vecturithrix sp.]